MTIRARQRLWHWRVVHYLSIIRLRRHVVLGMALIGVLAAWIITANMRPVYSSQASVRVEGMDFKGYITNGMTLDMVQQLHHQQKPKPGMGTW